MKLVSVIIPYFKKKKYIADALQSVLNQTHSNLEIIIIYDDPKKEDLEYIKNLIKNDERIKLIINNKNLGAGISRNVGIDQSNGSFVAFIDSDDQWVENKIEKQIRYMTEKNINFLHTSYKIINEKNEYVSARKARNFLNINDLIKSCDIGLSTVIIRKNILKSNRFPNLKTKEDFVLWLNLILDNVKIYGMDENLVLWKKSNNSLSSSTFQKLLDGFRVYNSYMKFNVFKSIYYLLCLSFNYFKK